MGEASDATSAGAPADEAGATGEDNVLAWRPRADPAESTVRPSFSGTWRYGAVAAALVAVVAGYSAFSAQRQALRLSERLAAIDGPQANVALVDLYPDDMVLRGETSDQPPAEVPAAAERATLILNSQQPPSSGPFLIEIRDLDGNVVQVVDGLTTDADSLLTLSLATASLDGESILVLLDPASDQTLEAYRVRAP